MLLAGGFALLVAALLLSALPANATTMGGWRYTDHAAPAATGRIIDLFVDSDFDDYERGRIVAAMRQWNYVLNGFVRFQARTLPDNPTREMLTQIKRSGGWVVARVDSRHPMARQGEGAHALAVTAGGRGGFVYMISDRIGHRDLTGVIMHEFGHVLGAGHDGSGLMAPVYNPRWAVALIAQRWRWSLQCTACRSTASTGVSDRAAPTASLQWSRLRTPVAAIADRWRHVADADGPQQQGWFQRRFFRVGGLQRAARNEASAVAGVVQADMRGAGGAHDDRQCPAPQEACAESRGGGNVRRGDQRVFKRS